MTELLLVMGRTSRQGVGVNVGKGTAEFREATSFVEVAASDAGQIGLVDGQAVEVISRHGQIRVVCRVKPDVELQPGVAFMAYGPLTSRLMSGETHGTGMPDSKLVPVRLQPIEREVEA